MGLKALTCHTWWLQGGESPSQRGSFHAGADSAITGEGEKELLWKRKTPIKLTWTKLVCGGRNRTRKGGKDKELEFVDRLIWRQERIPFSHGDRNTGKAGGGMERRTARHDPAFIEHSFYSWNRQAEKTQVPLINSQVASSWGGGIRYVALLSISTYNPCLPSLAWFSSAALIPPRRQKKLPNASFICGNTTTKEQHWDTQLWSLIPVIQAPHSLSH